MKSLDDDARILVEKNIDAIVKEPEKSEDTYRTILRGQGIEPNLEPILSFITGMFSGIVDGLYYLKQERFMNLDERTELMELLKRRAFELRQAFISTRIEE